MGDIVTLRSALADAFFFVAFRSFVAAVLMRVVLIAGVFILVFANHASAQDSLLTRFLGNFFNDSQDIPNSPWPYNSGPPSELRKFSAPQNSPPFPYAEYQLGGSPATATSRPSIR